MGEKSFIQSLRESARKIDPQAYIWKTSDKVSIGIPDLWIILSGCLIVLEAKAASSRWVNELAAGRLDRLNPASLSGQVLGHPFSGPQIGVMRQIARAGGRAMGAVQVSATVAFIVHPRDIPAGGNFEVQQFGKVCTRVTKENHIWRVDQWPNLLYES